MPRILLLAGIGLIVVVVVVTAIVLFSRRQSTKPGQTPTDQPITLAMWRPIDSEDIWKPIIAQYQQEHPNIRIKYFQKDLKTYELEVLNALSAGAGPDIWAVHNSWLVKHQGKLTPAPAGLMRISKEDKRSNESIVKNNFVPIVAQEAILDGKVFGLPGSVDTLAVYVNPKLLAKRDTELSAGLVQHDPLLFSQGPRTWDEFITLVKFLTKKDGDQITQAGAALGTANNHTRAVDLLATLMLQNGTQMESPDQLTATFNLPAQKSTGESFSPGLNALEFLTSFALPTKETYTWNNSFPEALEAFLADQVVMIPGYAWLGQTIRQKNPEFKYQIFPLPQIRGSAKSVDFANYWLEAVGRNSKNPEAAWDFIKFATSRGLSLYLTSTKRPSPLRQDQAQLPTSILDRVFWGHPFNFQASSAVPWYRGRDPQNVEAAMAVMIEDVISRGVSTENALNKAAKAITEIFRANQTLPTSSQSSNQK